MMNKKQNISIVIILFLCIGLGAFFIKQGLKNNFPIETTGGESTESEERNEDTAEDSTENARKVIVNEKGKTLKKRFYTPEGFERVSAKKESFSAFVRNYKLKKSGSPILYHDGSEKENQGSHAAVFCLPIEEGDLQQCADSIMRMYGEYYWQSGQYDKIAFHFVNGFLAEYSKWRQGYRIQINGNKCEWTLSASADDSYESFKQYMRVVFSYASTLSMEQESKEISLSKMHIGDVFLKGGSPGHVVMVVDVCEDAEGKKAFLLAQGFMPAQEFHVVKNPAHEEDPWYYEEEITYPLSIPGYTFEEGSLRRLKY